MGGLTAMRELLKILPSEDIIYFGDTGRVPYGGKSPETITRYARQDTAFLKTFSPKAILIACGTVSTTSLHILRQENDIPILGVVEPAVETAVSVTKNGKIGVIGTKATIRTGAYKSAILARKADAQVMSSACPLFVPLVENGRVDRSDPVTRQIVSEYLEPFKEAGIDTLVLGCTHYPLLAQAISDFLGDGVALIDTGRECSRALKALLAEGEMLNSREHAGKHEYYVSDSASDFSELAYLFLGDVNGDKVGQVEISRF